MAWLYVITEQKTYDPSRTLSFPTYSGHAEGKNNPALMNRHDVGPTPAGRYKMGPWFDDPGGKGPTVTHLTPLGDTDTFGRTGLMVHGDSLKHPGTASLGCAIVGHDGRVAMSVSPDQELDVVVAREVEA